VAKEARIIGKKKGAEAPFKYRNEESII